MEGIVPASVAFDERELLQKLAEFWAKDAAAKDHYRKTGTLGGGGMTKLNVTIEGTAVSLEIVSDQVILAGFRYVYLACDATELFEQMFGRRTPGIDRFDLGTLIMQRPEGEWVAAQGVAVSNEIEFHDPWPRHLEEALYSLTL